MGHLTVNELIKALTKIKKERGGNTIVFIGDDDELNGIHCAWFVQEIEKGEMDDIMQDEIEYEKAVLIS